MAYKGKKNTVNTTPEVVEAEKPKENTNSNSNSLKKELVELYKALDSINIEQQNEKIKKLTDKLAKIIKEYDSFVEEENKQNLEYAEKLFSEGDMIVKRYSRSKPNVIKKSNSKTPFSLGIKEILLFFLGLLSLGLFIVIMFLI